MKWLRFGCWSGVVFGCWENVGWEFLTFMNENSLFLGGTRIKLLGDQIIVGCNELRLICVSNWVLVCVECLIGEIFLVFFYFSNEELFVWFAIVANKLESWIQAPVWWIFDWWIFGINLWGTDFFLFRNSYKQTWIMNSSFNEKFVYI